MNRAKTFLLQLVNNRRYLAVASILVFAAAGTALILRSTASDGLATPTAPNELILSYTTPHYNLPAVDELSAFHPAETLLYGDGRLICADAQSPSQLTTRQLTEEQITDLVTRINDTDFLKLKDNYTADGYVIPTLSDSITLNLEKGFKKVTQFSGEEPAGFTKTKAVIEDICAQTTTTFKPAEAVVGVLKAGVSSEGTATEPEGDSALDEAQRRAEEARDVARETTQQAQDNIRTRLETLFGELPAQAEQPAFETLHGFAISEILDQLDGTKAQFTANGAVYETVVYPVIPDYKIPVRELSSGKSNTVSAAGTIPVQYNWFRPNDQGVASQANQTADIANSIHGWYRGQIGKEFPLEVGGTITGSQNEAWYKTCRKSNGCARSDEGHDTSTLVAVSDNLIKQYAQAGRSINLLVQFDTVPGNCAGIAGHGVDPNTGKLNGGFAISTGMAGECQEVQMRHSVPAHELGHTMQLQHIENGDGTLMDHVKGRCKYDWPNCALNGDQKNFLNGSAYFNGGGDSSPPPPPPAQQPSPPPAPSQRYPQGATPAEYYQIQFMHNKKCIDFHPDQNQNGGTAYQWGCHGGANQQFQILYREDGGESGYYKIRSRHNSNCIDADLNQNRNGGKIQQWACISGQDNQLAGVLLREQGHYKIRFQHNNKCLDADLNQNRDSGQIIQWDCLSGSTNQLVKLIPVGGSSNPAPNPTPNQPPQNPNPAPQPNQPPNNPPPSSPPSYRPPSSYLKLQVKGKCMDVRGPSTADNTQIQQWDCVAGNTQANQQFRFEDRGNGYYRLIANHSNKCVEFQTGDFRNGGRLRQMSCGTSDNQLFQVRSLGNSSYWISSKAGGRCIDSPYSGNGGILHQWDCISGNANQVFRFTSVSSGSTSPPPAAPQPSPQPQPSPSPPPAPTFDPCTHSILRQYYSKCR